jgi:hypothetical protein
MKIINYNNLLTQKTWQINADAGTWSIEPIQGRPNNLNNKERYISIIKNTWLSFKEWIQVVEFTIVGNYKETDSFQKFSYNEFKSEEFISFLETKVQDFQYDISHIELKVALWVFILDEEGNVCKERQWVYLKDEFDCYAGKEDSSAYINFNLNHTLFHYGYKYDNSELFSLNKAFLEASLQEWERCLGQISEIQGLNGIYKYGYTPTELFLPYD